MKKLFSLMMTAFIGLTAFAAEEKSLCPAGTLADGKVTHELECCTIVQEQGESTTALKSVSPWQAPAKSVMTITPKEGVSIEQFIVNTKNTTLGTYIGKSELTNATKTATNNGLVTFTVTNGTEPVVMKFVSTTIKFCELTITYTQEGGSVTPEPEDTTIVTPEPEDPVIPEPEDTTVVTPEPETGITYNVTVPAGTKACYIAGEMNSWSFTEMTKVDDTHYTLKLADATATMKYKYCSGPGWAYVEKSASGDEIGDRTYTNADVVVKWASVYDPGNAPTPGEAKDITIKAKVPATWTNTITAWVWPTGGNGKEVTPAKEGEWYVYTEKCSELNIIFKNGAGWNGDKNQTVDITISESTCVEITAGTGKANYTKVDCEENPGEEPGDDPVVDPETGVTYNVTVPAGTKACYIAGEMNTWSFTEMTKVDETHYTITIAEATTAMGYKYCSGPSWDYVEKTASGDEVANRIYSANDVVESWLAVYEPAGEEPGDDPVDPNPGDDPVVDPETGVTYNVTVPAGTKACYIAGEMNGWNQQEMTKVDDTHYTITIATATTAMKYKYCSGPSWDYVEMQADGVTDVQDRTYAANDVVEAWKAVYDPAGEEPGEDPSDDPVVDPETGVTYNVTVPAGTKACYIAGEMNEWKHQEMTKVDETHYTITIAEATTAMKYKYCSGPDWAYVEMQADGVTDVQDRTYAANDVVEAWKAVYDPAGEEPGEDPGDDPVVDPETGVTYNVTVPAGTKACYIAGEMNAWNQQEMTKVDETHYTITIAEATTAQKYKYCSGPDWAYVEKTATGEEVADRTYSANDVVESWLAVYDPSVETAVDNVAVGEKAVKVIRNGQMYIIRNGVIYNAMGQIAE